MDPQPRALVAYGYERLSQIEGLRILGPLSTERAGVLAFSFETIHPHDLAAVLDQHGVAVRAGHHCAQPIHDKMGIVASARASFYFYNTPAEIDALVAALEEAVKIFAF